jgi:hypothetical protein
LYVRITRDDIKTMAMKKKKIFKVLTEAIASPGVLRYNIGV